MPLVRISYVTSLQDRRTKQDLDKRTKNVDHFLIPRMDEGGEEERAVQVHHLLHPSETQNPMCCDQTTKVTHLILVQSCLPATTAHQVLVQGSSLDSHLPFQKNVGAYGLWLTTAARFS